MEQWGNTTSGWEYSIGINLLEILLEILLAILLAIQVAATLRLPQYEHWAMYDEWLR